MKIQDSASKPTTTFHKQTLGSGSNFKEKIPSYINEINLSNSSLVQQNPSITKTRDIIKKIHLDTHMNKLRSEVSTILETSTKLYLFLGRTMMENYSQIIVYEYLRADGSHKSMEMNGVKGEITCLKARFCQKRKKLSSQKSENIKNTKKSSSLKNSKQGTYQIVLLMGTIGGYLKTLRFGDTQPSDDGIMQIHSIKLDYSQIVTVTVLQPEYYSGTNVCLVLSLTNRVYLVNFDSMSLIAVFMPTILSCEVGLGLSVNQEQQYFIQSCQGGYIIFWDINEHVLQLIKKSAGGQSDTSKQVSPPPTQKQQNPQSSYIPGTFHPPNIHHSISPLSIFHSATISGLKYCQLYGNLLLLITQGGLLKLLAINKSTNTHVNENQYCSLIEYQVEDGELVSDVKFYPETRELFVVKSEVLAGVSVRNGLEKYLPVREFNVEKQIQKKKNGKTQSTKPYKPKVLKSTHNNILPQKNKSLQNQHNRCYFERIVFNSQLQIEKVDKVYPSHKIDSIESLEMVDRKDIIVLRARQFYLIGSTDTFKVVDLN